MHVSTVAGRKIPRSSIAIVQKNSARRDSGVVRIAVHGVGERGQVAGERQEREQREHHSAEDPVASARTRAGLGGDRLRREQRAAPPEHEQTQGQREDALVVAGPREVFGADDVLHEHVRRVCADAQRKGRAGDEPAPRQDRSGDGQRRRDEQGDSVQADGLVAQRLADVVLDRAAGERAEQGDGDQAGSDRHECGYERKRRRRGHRGCCRRGCSAHCLMPRSILRSMRKCGSSKSRT
jgi:hypothetical protein